MAVEHFSAYVCCTHEGQKTIFRNQFSFHTCIQVVILAASTFIHQAISLVAVTFKIANGFQLY